MSDFQHELTPTGEHVVTMWQSESGPRLTVSLAAWKALSALSRWPFREE